MGRNWETKNEEIDFSLNRCDFQIIPFDGECYVKINGTEYKISVLSDSLPQEFENIFGTDVMKNLEIDFNDIFKKYRNDTKM